MSSSSSSESDIKRFSFTASGSVQGVFYRKFTQSTALSLQLKGWVRNTRGGDVTGEAQGAAEALEKFRVKLEEGPEAARVEKVEWTEVGVKEKEDVKGTEGEFLVLRTH